MILRNLRTLSVLFSLLSVIILSFNLSLYGSNEMKVKVASVKGAGIPMVFQSVIRYEVIYMRDFNNVAKGIDVGQCSAVIVSDNVALTAAHCVVPAIGDKKLKSIVFQGTVAQKIWLSPEYMMILKSGKKRGISINENYDLFSSDIAVIAFPEGTFKNYKKMKIKPDVSLKSQVDLKAVGVRGDLINNAKFIDSEKIIVDYQINALEDRTVSLQGINKETIGQVFILDGISKIYPDEGYSGGPLFSKEDPDTVVGILSSRDFNELNPHAVFCSVGTKSNVAFLKDLVKKEGIRINGIGEEKLGSNKNK